MVTNARRHPSINFMNPNGDNYKVDIGMSPCISYHHYYPCFGAFYYCNPYFIILYTCYTKASHHRREGCYCTKAYKDASPRAEVKIKKGPCIPSAYDTTIKHIKPLESQHSKGQEQGKCHQIGTGQLIFLML